MSKVIFTFLFRSAIIMFNYQLLSFSVMTSFPETPGGGVVKVKQGHAAVFRFPNITSEPSPSVSWQSDDNTLLYGTKYAVTADNSLVILDVDANDVKRYR